MKPAWRRKGFSIYRNFFRVSQKGGKPAERFFQSPKRFHVSGLIEMWPYIRLVVELSSKGTAARITPVALICVLVASFSVRHAPLFIGGGRNVLRNAVGLRTGRGVRLAKSFVFQVIIASTARRSASRSRIASPKLIRLPIFAATSSMNFFIHASALSCSRPDALRIATG